VHADDQVEQHEHRRASLGSAHTIIAKPNSASRRWSATPITTCSPVIQVIPRPTTRNSGPYGDGVSRHIVGTLLVSGSALPSASAGPTVYGSSPRAAISLCAR
jgi:hypothetical protein